MNEQLKLLGEQAGFHVTNFEPDADIREPLEKFAELIVQDIINVLESKNEIRHVAFTTYDLGTVESTIEKSINAITEHYGMNKHTRIKNERTMGRKVSSF